MGKIHTSSNQNHNSGSSWPEGFELSHNMILLKCYHGIITSIDNGNTWVDNFTLKANYQRSMVYFSGNYFLLAGSPQNHMPGMEIYLYKSSNGSSWEKVFQQQVKINYMYAENKIYLLGDNGQLIYSDDGINWNVKRVTGQSLNYMTKLN